MNTLEILKQARALISKPESWTQDAIARESRGWEVNSESDCAVCWCSVGAIKRAAKLLSASDYFRDACASIETPDSIEDFNDSHTHAEVLELFDKTIERLEKEA